MHKLLLNARRSRTVLFVAALALLGSATGCAAGQTLTGTLRFGGQERTYVLHLPDHPAGGRPMPLVIVLHGFGGSGANVLEQGRWIEKAGASGFIVVGPDGTTEHDNRRPNLMNNPRSWNSGPDTGSPASRRRVDDVGFLRALIEEIARTHPVDKTRIYATGFSNGAAMAFRIALELSERIAAVAPVANALLVPARPLAKPVSLLMIWGTADPLNPIGGGRVSRSGEALLRPSAEASWRQWSRLLNCTGETLTEQPAPGASRVAYRNCDAGTSAELVTIEGLGHQWPGGRIYLRMVSGPGSNVINATDTIWSFFSAHAPRPGATPSR